MNDHQDMLVMNAGTGVAPDPAQLFRRKLPGEAYKKNGEIVFLKGRVIHAGWGRLGSSTQFIETDSKQVPYVQLCGHNYIYWCEHCRLTIFEQEFLLFRQIRSSNRDKQRCVFCEAPILPVAPGTKVRLHHRYAVRQASENVAAAGWGGWWAEVWEW